MIIVIGFSIVQVVSQAFQYGLLDIVFPQRVATKSEGSGSGQSRGMQQPPYSYPRMQIMRPNTLQGKKRGHTPRTSADPHGWWGVDSRKQIPGCWGELGTTQSFQVVVADSHVHAPTLTRLLHQATERAKRTGSTRGTAGEMTPRSARDAAATILGRVPSA